MPGKSQILETLVSRAADGRKPDGGWSPGHAIALLVVAALIIYASLFPFDFSRAQNSSGAVAHLLHSWADWDEPRDLVANLLLYMPLGFCAVRALPPRLASARRIPLAALLGAALAACAELVQFHEPYRVSTMGDVYADALGAAFGGIAAVAWGRRAWPLATEAGRSPAAELLLTLFLGYRLYPYVPTESLGKYWHAMSALLFAPRLAPGGLIHLGIAWLLVAAAIEAMYGRRRWLWLFPLFALMEFAGHVLVIWQALQWTDIAAAALAAAAWLALPQSWRDKPVLLAVLLAGLLGVLQLQHAWAAVALHPVAGRPLHTRLLTELHRVVPGLCERAFLYGGLIWALCRCGVGLWTGIGATCGLLVAASLVRVVLWGAPFDFIGLAAVLAVGGVFGLLSCAGGKAQPGHAGGEAIQPGSAGGEALRSGSAVTPTRPTP